MGKSIVVFFNSKPFGVFSNKTNAWLAIERNFDLKDLFIYSEIRNEFLPTSYALMTARLNRAGKTKMFNSNTVSGFSNESSQVSTLAPQIHVYQFETNVATDNKLYKSTEEKPTEEKE